MSWDDKIKEAILANTTWNPDSRFTADNLDFIDYEKLAKAVQSLKEAPNLEQDLTGAALSDVQRAFKREQEIMNPPVKERGIVYNIFKLLLEARGLNIDKIRNATKGTNTIRFGEFNSNQIFKFPTVAVGGAPEKVAEEPKLDENTSEASSGEAAPTVAPEIVAPEKVAEDPKLDENSSEASSGEAAPTVAPEIVAPEKVAEDPKLDENTSEASSGEAAPTVVEPPETVEKTAEASSGGGFLDELRETKVSNVGRGFIGGCKKNSTRRLRQLQTVRRLTKKIYKVLI
jgi:hypothetical protein